MPANSPADPRSQADPIHPDTGLPMRYLMPLRGRDGSLRAFATVDVIDVQRVAQHKWRLNTGGYAARNVNVGKGNGKRQYETMHRFVLGLTVGDGQQVDHINGNRLDNRRCNLRIVTASGNAQNQHGAHPNATSTFKGVCWDRQRGKWRAQANLNGRNIYLGLFDDEAEAGRAADAYRAEHMPFSPEARGASK